MKQVSLLGGALAAAMLGSYMTWTADDDTSAPSREGVPVVRATPDTLQSVTWQSDDRTVVMTQPQDAKGDYVRVEVTSRKQVPVAEPVDAPPEPAAAGEDTPADAEAPAADTEPETTTVEETQVFTGNVAAVDLWAGFAPLKAMRQLDTSGADGLVAYGLDEPTGAIVFTTSTGEQTAQVGGEAFGTRDAYLGVDDNVFLVDDKDIKPLRFASNQLVERRLQPFDLASLRELTVQRGSETVRFVLKNPDDPARRTWVSADAPDTPDEVAATWIDKLLRIRTKTYPGADSLPAGLTESFRVELKGAKDVWNLSLAEVPAATPGEEPSYFATSDFVRDTVELTRALAADPMKDVATLFQPRDASEDAEQAPPTDEDAPAE